MSDKTTDFPWPVAVLSFGRPALLERVLTSLRTQTHRVPDERGFLFQDGTLDQWANAEVIPQATRDNCISVFRKIFPHGNVISSDKNLGIALNFDRAERMMFEQAEAAAFFEDDLVLSEHYLDALSR